MFWPCLTDILNKMKAAVGLVLLRALNMVPKLRNGNKAELPNPP